ncbi:serine protease FAM111A-like [Dendrobates tinctorius]|uniref:serine protease FAM111A-like n=1 Tax=Dendrobates tinctorius TaxID=92724 RepID=UPI003CC95B38
MAEHISNHPDPSAHLDKENQSNSVELNQTNRTSILTPLQDSQSCNLAVNSPLSTRKVSGQLDSGNNTNWLTELRKKIEEKKSEKTQNVEKTPRRKKPLAAARRAKAAGKGHPSNLRKSTEQGHPSPGIVEETVNKHESTEKKVRTEPTTTEEKGAICVSYKWKNKGKEHDITGFNTPIIDFGKKTLLKAKRSQTKKFGYLFILAQKLNAIVNPWVPCGAIEKDELLELSFKKITGTDEIVGPETSKYPTFHNGLFFKVKQHGKTNGGQPVKIIRKKQYYCNHNPMAVFGFRDQTINQALQNDKRFTINGQFSLEDSECGRHSSDVLLSELLTSDIYTIVMLRRDTFSEPNKKSPNKTLAKKNVQNKEEGRTSPLPGTSAPRSEPCVDPTDQFVSSRLSFKFSNDFQKLVSTVGQQELQSRLLNDYTKDVLYKDPMSATTFRLLYQHLDNVALLTYDTDGGSKSGTLFLLTETLGLTCYHVVKLLIKSRTAKNVQVIFNYESKENPNPYYGKYKKVLWFNEQLDCAILRIEISPSPPGLLEHLAPPPQEGAVCIIGHPRGEHKQIDPKCSVIAFSQRAESILGTLLSDRSYIHILTQYNFRRMCDQTLTTYDSCLYWGASGAPVLNDHGELVAVHTGGYPADTHLKKKSVIEYGRSAVDIIIHGAIKIPELSDTFRKLVNKKENLSKYLQPGGHPVKMQPVIRQLKKLWEESVKKEEQNSGGHPIMMQLVVRQSVELGEVSDNQLEPDPEGHPENMQPVITQPIEPGEESKSQMEPDPGVDVDDIPDSPMEIS